MAGQWKAGVKAALRGSLKAVAFALAAGAAPHALAQSTNILPDLTTVNVPFDPEKVAGLPAGAKRAFASAKEKLQLRELDGLILVASPDGAIWTLNGAPKGMADYNPSESARQALEICEFRAGQPCVILSVDGYEAGRPSGSPPEPQRMLSNRPSDFDATTLPFAPASKRAGAAAYVAVKGPRALAITTSGLWLWRGGSTLQEAIDKTMADCAEAFKTADCVLYAVGSRVVFAAQ